MSRKKARSMLPAELIAIRESLGYQQADMARFLGWPERTYEDREAGRRGIPADAAEWVRSAPARDAAGMDRLRGWIKNRIAADFPTGIR